MTRRSHLVGAALACALAALPLGASAQFGGLGAALSSVSSALTGGNPLANPAAAPGNLVSGYVAANKDVLTANGYMAEALGLSDAAALARSSAEALTDGATKGNLADADKAVSTSSDAISKEMAKGHVQLDSASKQKFATGLVSLASGLVRYASLRKTATSLGSNLNPAALSQATQTMYIATSLPAGFTNLTSALNNAITFARGNDIPVPDDATKALAAL